MVVVSVARRQRGRLFWLGAQEGGAHGLGVPHTCVPAGAAGSLSHHQVVMWEKQAAGVLIDLAALDSTLQICLGPVCVPLHLLLPFLVTLAHQRGYLRWFRKDWVRCVPACGLQCRGRRGGCSLRALGCLFGVSQSCCFSTPA